MLLFWLLVWLVFWDPMGVERRGGREVVVRSGTLWLLLYCTGVIGVVDLVGVDLLIVLVVD